MGYLTFLSLSTAVDGGYTDWTPWSECSVTCGGGEQTRTRECTNPSPVGDGKDCEHLGPNKESQKCNIQKCRKSVGHLFVLFVVSFATVVLITDLINGAIVIITVSVDLSHVPSHSAIYCQYRTFQFLILPSGKCWGWSIQKVIKCQAFTLSPPRVINFKFPLQPHQQHIKVRMKRT